MKENINLLPYPLSPRGDYRGVGGIIGGLPSNFCLLLIFRYDNTEHHQKLNLPNFPHHKHDRSEKNVINSNAPFLKDVIQEIIELI